MKAITILLILNFMLHHVSAQTIIPLYEGAVPDNNANVVASLASEIKEADNGDGILRLKNISMPSLTVYKAAKPNGTGVIICPGGGYYILAAGHEGEEVAKRFNEMGVTAFVLKYRLPTTPGLLENKTTGPLMDAQQAISLVRKRAQEFGVNADKIGILGFSAGGHLAATAATHFSSPVLAGAKPSEVRPDFVILVYPVVSFQTPITHMGSREALLGKAADQASIDYYSNELQVTPETPPAFLVHAADDDAVPVENSIEFMLACKRNKVPVEMHIYPKGGHGFGMHNPTTGDQWMDRVENWFKNL